MAPYRSREFLDPAIVLSEVPRRGARAVAPIGGQWLTAAMIVSAAIVVLLMVGARLTIDPRGPMNGLVVIGGIIAATLRYRFRAPHTNAQRIARDTAEYFGLFAFISLLGALASYPAAAESHGFIDARLEYFDQLMRFNWLGWYDFTVAHPSAQRFGSLAYDSIFVTPFVPLSVMARANRQAEARAFLASFWLAAVATLILFVAFPARGPLAFLVHGPVPYLPSSALYQSELIPLLRDHAMHQVDLGALRGLVCAPSFHTSAVVLYVLAAWPVRSLRWPVLAVNVAMLLSIPVEGTHYLTDMIGGALVGFAAWGAVSWASRRAGVAGLRYRGVPQNHPHLGKQLKRQAN